MNEALAALILHDCIDERGLFRLGGYVAWLKCRDEIVLDGEFTADQLEAMAWWMRNKKEGAK